MTCKPLIVIIYTSLQNALKGVFIRLENNDNNTTVWRKRMEYIEWEKVLVYYLAMLKDF